MPENTQPGSAGFGYRKWWFCVAIACCAFALSWWPQGLPQLRYERTALMNGEDWRLVTTHLVHLNAAHLLLNVAGLFLLCELLWADMPLRHAAGLLLWSALGVSAMLWWLQPELEWYAGMSGALHGLWAGSALAAVIPGPWTAQKRAGAAGLALLLIKLASETLFGVSAATTHAIGGQVISVAHCYGAMSGALYLLLWQAMRDASKIGRSISRRRLTRRRF